MYQVRLFLFSMISGAMILLLGGCLSSRAVTATQWNKCQSLCKSNKGLKEACVEPFQGKGCHCNDDKIFWYD